MAKVKLTTEQLTALLESAKKQNGEVTLTTVGVTTEGARAQAVLNSSVERLGKLNDLQAGLKRTYDEFVTEFDFHPQSDVGVVETAEKPNGQQYSKWGVGPAGKPSEVEFMKAVATNLVQRINVVRRLQPEGAATKLDAYTRVLDAVKARITALAPPPEQKK